MGKGRLLDGEPAQEPEARGAERAPEAFEAAVGDGDALPELGEEEAAVLVLHAVTEDRTAVRDFAGQDDPLRREEIGEVGKEKAERQIGRASCRERV